MRWVSEKGGYKWISIRIIAVTLLVLLSLSIQSSACYIGDLVWQDLNANGIQDSGEKGVYRVKVELYKCGSTSVAQTAYTNTNGFYGFYVDSGRSYYVKFILPSGYVFSPKDQGSNDAKDSDADVTNGKTICTYISRGEEDRTWDAGIYKPASIGDYVWYDKDCDGIQDTGEAGVGNVKVELYTCAGTFVASTYTDASGLYKFTGLVPGDYKVKFILPSDYAFTKMDQGADDAKDSDADASTGTTACTSLAYGETDYTWDAGIYKLAGLGNYVWHDVNRNGIQDDGETGVGGVQVELYTCEGTFVASTFTSDSGFYEFTGLQPGDYTVKFILPSGYSFTLMDQGSDDAKDSDADSQGNGPCVTLVSGEFNDTLDAGLVHDNNEIPEFPTIALPMAAILGLAFVFMRRK